ncbi:hypothetical protein BN938_0499 [Mucinivorans hirudinis]|uniref:Uncharacterized protein n=1 Tax=Mucinivorans hirudinis TaxID=1433126 RepID=A0A060R5W0_9BACT|nr:hypothetical protein BN938_0110 [Mucinivorans hirudinis]CDN30389.1 hypothetical protein BN938_0283 [Mucinivorans hirudinis]CDN30604.1 hypothetical protein BN938_0499 [Mucinivorans hirudinis]
MRCKGQILGGTPNPTSTPKSFFGVFLLKNGGDFILLS